MENIYKIIENEFENIIKDLSILISMKTVENIGENGTPFGCENKRALEFIIEKAKEFGIKYKNLDDYLCWLEIGKGNEMIGIPVHLDVVPEGEGWETEPFKLEEKDGYFYGRGVVDNKGPAIMMLYILKFLKENEKLHKRVRVIFGTNEETGMKCIKYYLDKKEEVPIMGFTPDALYPVVIGEKGRLHIKIFKNLKIEKEKEYLKFIGGKKSNVVPDYAECSIYNYENNNKKQLNLNYKGAACHASTPEKGINAITELIKIILLNKGRVIQNIEILEKINKLVTEEENEDLYKISEKFGKLTLNIGILSIDEKKFTSEIDIRYPEVISEQEIKEYLQNFLGNGYEIKILNSKPLHYVEENSIIVNKLLNTLTQLKIILEEKPMIIGGGTYASYFDNMVGFGPKYQNIRTGGHGKNENISKEEFKKNLFIYYNAILELCK